MRNHLWLSLSISLFVLLIPIGSVSVARSAPTPARLAVASPASTTPYPLVTSGVNDFTISDPKVFWYSLPPCTQVTSRPSGPAANSYETIQRIATYGGLPRELWQHAVNANCPSGNDVVSNVITDGSYLYWMSTVHNGLVKLSVDANAGTKPVVVSHAVSGAADIALAQGTLFVMTQPGLGHRHLWSVDPGSGAGTQLMDTGPSATDFQTDGGYLYWIDTNYNLDQWDVHYATYNGSLAGHVFGYVPIGAAVYIGQNASIIEYSNRDQSTTPIYTSNDSSNIVYSLAYDSGKLFWLEDHPLPCGSPGCFPTAHNDLLTRAGADGSNISHIYTYAAGTSPQASQLAAVAGRLFWLENGALVRLTEDAADQPDINLVAGGIEVTQGIQDLSNSVPLIQDRDTYVRFYTHSGGPAISSVPGVTAWLYRVSHDGVILDGPLTPINPAGQQLAVSTAPDRSNLNDSFLFELPYSWTETGASDTYLRAVVNPGEDPIEPNYNDNEIDSPALFFRPSPRLTVYFISWGYLLNGTVYFPNPVTDMFQAFSWIRRAYPLASAPGFVADPGPGLHTAVWSIFDSGLGARISQSAPYCTKNNPTCANGYTLQLETALHLENGVPNNVAMYGMFFDTLQYNQGGSARCAPTCVGSGPAGCCVAWDTDGSFADWYAGHEIGHMLGRVHPADSAALCGNSADDPNYPYPNGLISPAGGQMEGFDVGEAALGLPLAVYPGVTWSDVMTYCNYEWISDYTYSAMYTYMQAHPLETPAGASAPAADLVRHPALSGNWLAAYGDLTLIPASATFSRIRHLNTVASVPALVPGPYSLELVDGSDHTLVSYPFTPLANDDAPGTLSFDQVITAVAGATQLRLVQLAGNVTLATQAIPPHAPSLSNVHLVGAPTPVSGSVTLAWNASDQDGNSLTFDIFYSRDGGATLQPLQLGLSGLSATIDTAPLGGSHTALLRVVATDGVNTAQADSAVLNMGNKPPQPAILNPGSGAQRSFGQLINFGGEAPDAQDGGVASSGLAWSDQYGPLGTGALLSVSNLPVGTDVITLTATDSANQVASTNITVYVDDNLNRPGPILSAAPMQFAWSFGSNLSPTQSSLLKFDNVGGGTLTWTASLDVPWLKLSATSGTVPASLTLTASPAGFPDDTAHLGHIVLNIQGSSAPPVIIPVGMAIGGSYSEPPRLEYQVFLPIMRH